MLIDRPSKPITGLGWSLLVDTMSEQLGTKQWLLINRKGHAHVYLGAPPFIDNPQTGAFLDAQVGGLLPWSITMVNDPIRSWN